MGSLKNKYFELLYAQNETPNYIAELILLKLEILPKKLYRYRPINEFLEDTLVNDIAFLCPAGKFNDPYDSGLTVNYNETHLHNIKNSVLYEFCKKFHHLVPGRTLESFSQEVQTLTNDVPLKNLGFILGKTLNQNESVIEDIELKINLFINQTYDIYENYMKDLNNKFQSKVFITCFSEVNDSILMWSHYAQFHQGICIEYDFSDLDYTSRTLLTLSPVKYTDKLFDIFKYPNRSTIDKIQLAALIKYNCWKYEAEWRLISFFKEEQRFKLNKPTAVILGSKISQENKAWISKICSKRGIPVKQASLDRTEYKLHIK